MGVQAGSDFDDIAEIEEQLKEIGVVPKDFNWSQQIEGEASHPDSVTARTEEVNILLRPLEDDVYNFGLALFKTTQELEVVKQELQKLDKDVEDVLVELAKKVRLLGTQGNDLEARMTTVEARVTSIEVTQKQYRITPFKVAIALAVLVLIARPGLMSAAWGSLGQAWQPTKAVPHKIPAKRVQHRSHPH